MSTPTRPIVISLTQAPPPAGLQPTRPTGRPVAVERDGFILRSLGADDITPAVQSWFSDADMMQGLNLAGLNMDFRQLRSFVEKFDNIQNYIIGIFDKASALLVGFYTVDVDLKHRVGHITTGIGERSYLGKGVLRATSGALLDHFYAERNVEKFCARILAKNYRMIFNFRNNPVFVFEACLRQECLAPNGERLDILVFSAFKNPGADR